MPPHARPVQPVRHSHECHPTGALSAMRNILAWSAASVCQRRNSQSSPNMYAAAQALDRRPAPHRCGVVRSRPGRWACCWSCSALCAAKTPRWRPLQSARTSRARTLHLIDELRQSRGHAGADAVRYVRRYVPASVPGFVVAQLLGAVVACGLIRVLWPAVDAVAQDVVVPREAVDGRPATAAQRITTRLRRGRWPSGPMPRPLPGVENVALAPSHG